MADEPRNYVACWADGTPRGPMTLMSAKQTTGAGTEYFLPKALTAFGVEYFRGTTSTSNESTSALVVIQGRVGSTNWVTIGAATGITVNSATPAVRRSTNSVPVTAVRARISSFTTSAGNSTAGGENKIPITVYLTATAGSS